MRGRENEIQRLAYSTSMFISVGMSKSMCVHVRRSGAERGYLLWNNLRAAYVASPPLSIIAPTPLCTSY